MDNIDPLTHGTFVGREPELETLLDAAAQVEAGHARVVFVTGEPGSGKSTLLEALGARLAERAEQTEDPLCTLVTGRCDALMPSQATRGGLVPLQPFATASSQLTGPRGVQQADPETIGELVAGAAPWQQTLWERCIRLVKYTSPSLLGWLFPPAMVLADTARYMRDEKRSRQLAEQLEDQAQRITERPEPDQIVPQFVDVVSAISVEQPLAIAIDDLHWADDASIDMLFHLVRCFREGAPTLRVLLIAGFRPDEEDQRIERLVAEATRYLDIIRIDLDERSERAARTFCDAFIDLRPNHLPDEFRDLLAQRTNGNPLFVAELLRDLEDRGAIVQHHGSLELVDAHAADQLPSRVHDVIGRRLDNLARDERAALAAASVQGFRFTCEAVAALTGDAERKVLDLLDLSLRQEHGLVTDDEPPPGLERLCGYRFRHALVAEHVYRTWVDRNRRRLLHADMAEFLEQHADGTDALAGEIARHHEAAGNTDAAARWYITASRSLRRQGDLANELLLAERAIELATGGRTLDMGLLAQCAIVASHAALLTDRLDLAEQYAERAAAAAGDDPLLTARAALRKVGIQRRRGLYDEALATLETARPAIEAATEDDEAEVEADYYQQLGIVLGYLGRFDEAIAAHERGQEIGSPGRRRAVLNNLGSLLSQGIGRLDDALEKLRDAIELAEQAGNPAYMSRRNQARTLARLGRHADALEVAHTYRPRSDGALWDATRLAADATDGFCAIHAGRVEDARRSLTEFLDGMANTNVQRHNDVITANSIVALCHLAQADISTALVYAERAVQIRGDDDATADRELGSPSIALGTVLLASDPQRAGAQLSAEHDYWGQRLHRSYAADYNRFLCSAGVAVALNDRSACVRALDELAAANERCDGAGVVQLVTWMFQLIASFDEEDILHRVSARLTSLVGQS